MPDNSFGKSRRLLCAAEYQAVFDNASFKVADRKLLILARFNKLGYPRLGLVVSKKNIRMAVHRNRVKRLVRETFRRVQSQLGSFDIVFLARSGLYNLGNEPLSILLEESWRRVQKKQFAIQSSQVVEPTTCGN